MIYIASSIMNIPHSALEIYVSGCFRHCKGCQNEYIQKFGYGTSWTEWNKKNKKKYLSPIVEKIWILGGDLLCQEYEDALFLIKDIRRETNKELWLWTGETMEGIKGKEPLFEIASLFDYVKTGPYQKENKEKKTYDINGVSLEIAGSNQELYKVKNKVFEIL